jgi:hypothetical protein
VIKKKFPYLKTASNVAKGKGVSRTTIYNAINEGKLMGVEIDGVLFIDTRKENQEIGERKKINPEYGKTNKYKKANKKA